MFLKKHAPWIVFFITGAILYGLWQQSETRSPIREISYSELITQIESKKIHDVTIVGNEVSGHFQDNNREFTTYVPVDRKSTRLNSSHIPLSRMPSSA